MKVSRKVARRSRKHTSSISRKRLRSKKSYKKNSYRKKNAKTQKGGKRGRGYKRMRSHTHKRGKRFHRGGMSHLERAMNDPDSAEGRRLRAAAQRQVSDERIQTSENAREAITTAQGIEDAFSKDSTDSVCVTINDNTIDFYLRDTDQVIVLFKVKKGVRFSTTEPQKFYCVLRYAIEKQPDGEYIVTSVLRLTRVDNSEIAFSVGGKQMEGSTLGKNNTNQEFLAEKLKSTNFLQKMPYFKGGKEENRIDYDFSDPGNLPIFSALADILEDKDYVTMALEKCGSSIGYSAPALPASQPPSPHLDDRSSSSAAEVLASDDENSAGN